MKNKTIIGVVLVLIAFLGYLIWSNLFRVVSTYYESDEAHFKYGSLGMEKEGIPYLVWQVLPKMFPHHLPVGASGKKPYAYFGFIWEESKDIPIGLTKKIIGFPRLGVNCAMCHTGTYRKSPDDKPKLLLAGTAHQFDLQAYQRFLFKCANDPKFTPENIVTEIKKNHDLSFVETLIYRYLIVSRVKDGLLDREEKLTWQESQPPHGPGRSGLGLLGLPLGIPQEDYETKGSYDFMTLWNAEAQKGLPVHWDAFNTKRYEAFLTATAVMGAINKDLDRDAIKRLEKWLDEIQPPKYPFDIDNALAAKGRKLFDENCASCHAFGQPNTGQAIDNAEVGTDPYRLNSWPESAVEALKQWSIDKGYDSTFTHFRKTNGYKSVPLDGTWARAPYLHNGSVPTLRDLLSIPENRPKEFYRGYDVYDPVKVGFISEIAEENGYQYFKFDTRLLGNGNGGHFYGTDLLPEDKKALVEYMKTL